MTGRMRVGRVAVATTALAVMVALVAPEAATARSQSKWRPTTATRWEVGGGGDDFRTGYNPTEKRPPFISGGHLGTGDSDGPWLEWVTKISDLPSGVWLQAGLVVVDGIVYVAGGATNSFLALDAKTGLPIWRFAPDQRTDGYTAAYPASNAPVVKNGIVYVTFSSGYLYALNAKTGKKIWSYRARDGYRGPQPPGTDTGRCENGRCQRGPGEFDAVHPGVVYPKIHGATAFCDNKVFFMTLAGWAYGLDARTGKLLWKRYADAPGFPGELTWWEYAAGGPTNPNNRSAGSGTRRFEAVPGLGCLNGEIQAAGSDGQVRFLDPRTGRDSTKGGDVGPVFDRTDNFSEESRTLGAQDFCANAAFNCDIAVGLAVPPLGTVGGGDYIVTTLDNRIIRLNWDDHSPRWRRVYQAPLPLENETAGNRFLLSLDHGEHGFITQGVVGGPMALDPDVRGRGEDPILYAGAQDGRLYAIAINRPATNPECRRPGDGPRGPCLLSRTGVQPNTNVETPYTRRGEGGPWDFDEQALAGLTLGGNVLYAPTWDNKMTAFDVRNPANPRRIWEYEVKWDTTFQFPPFGERHAKPFADIDNKIFSAPALVGGRLYFSANDGRVYAFNLHKRVKTVKNLVILGSGTVPFIPQWKERLGAFDNVWTPADWYKNQVPPSGYRFPKAAGAVGAGVLLVGNLVLLWWYARRDDFRITFEEESS